MRTPICTIDAPGGAPYGILAGEPALLAEPLTAAMPKALVIVTKRFNRGMRRPSVATNRIDVEMKRFIHGMRRSDSKMEPFIPADGHPNRVRKGLVSVTKAFIHTTKRLVLTTKALIHMTKGPALVRVFPARREIEHLRKIDMPLSISGVGHPESIPRFGLTE